MAAIRVFLFLVFIAVITALFVKYVVLFLYKMGLKENKFFKKTVKKELGRKKKPKQ